MYRIDESPQASALILAVDSDGQSLSDLEREVARAGYRLLGFADAGEVVEAAETLEPDLILVDVRQEDESGLDLCRQIKSSPNLAHVPVVLLSADSLRDIIRRTREAGAAYFIRKPLDPHVLVELVDKALWMPHLVNQRIGARV